MTTRTEMITSFPLKRGGVLAIFSPIPMRRGDLKRMADIADRIAVDLGGFLAVQRLACQYCGAVAVFTPSSLEARGFADAYCSAQCEVSR